ncbi:MAG: response regulator [Candidatus Kapaibacterium sp.]|nr:MAG: response regulator [Candidatus Kapabacteria bacterium]
MQTICLVEDDKITRKLFVMLLERAEFSVKEFDEGASALDWIRTNTPDAVLSNIVLSGAIGGVEILHEVREVLKRQTPVLALTSFVRRGDREKYLEMGFNDCVAKPIDPQSFGKDFRTMLAAAVN